jgi:UDP-2,3-diacylglucosamine hydrolase
MKEGATPVAAFFASDVHLRIDRPERARRFARFVGALEPQEDTLTILGDLCDFWFEARQWNRSPLECAGLRALTEFRNRGGAVTVLLGNHDGWLGDYYVNLGLELRDEPYEITAHGVRVHMVHGHRLGPRRGWKAWMESRGFLRLFRTLPDWLASRLDGLLQWTNQRTRLRTERRYGVLFREYALRRRGSADLVIIGHMHTPLDAAELTPRLIVPGGWQEQSSYVKIDDAGAALIVETDEVLISP